MQGSELGIYLITVFISASLAFLSGAVPYALLIGRKTAGIDIREHGSGNTGATNVARTLGVGPGIAVFLLDVAKGAVAVFVTMGLLQLANYFVFGGPGDSTSPYVSGLYHDMALVIAGLFAMAGHVFSPFLNFKGGKGVSTALGAFLVIMPPAALCALAVFIVVVALSHYASLGSILSTLTLPFWSWLFYRNSIVFLLFCIISAAALVIAHRGNIVRLINHDEKKFSLGSSGVKKD
jgi:acyl phosphate:glycerol-3-phosphate acyltransferase